ncbi:uncharacterized protein [Epargyreus clarus]|uniref:uncharacterized protein n=1 Tax=Epargyreus clarus TaxID=520877 RepID=UPI003C2B3E5D
MKFLLLLVAVVGLAYGLADPGFYYKTENDYVDVDAVIADLPTLQSYADCFLERGHCTSLTESIRAILQDSVIRACDRCNLPQRERYAKFLKGLQARLPHEYIAFRQKYDPHGIYFDALEAVLQNYLPHATPNYVPYSALYYF